MAPSRLIGFVSLSSYLPNYFHARQMSRAIHDTRDTRGDEEERAKMRGDKNSEDGGKHGKASVPACLDSISRLQKEAG